MNSILQCLSNTRFLTEYCLQDHYLDDLNKTLSVMKGSLFCSYAALIKTIWKNYDVPVSPQGMVYVFNDEFFASSFYLIIFYFFYHIFSLLCQTSRVKLLVLRLAFLVMLSKTPKSFFTTYSRVFTKTLIQLKRNQRQ